MILITGASGHLGHAIADQLLPKLADGEKLVVSSRSPEKLSHFKALGVEVRAADFDDKNSLIKAFKGVNKVLLISGHAPNAHRIQQHKNAVSAAVLAGTQHVAYTSFFNAVPESRFLFAEVHAKTEALLKSSGLTYTIFRNAWYADLFTEGIEQILAQAKLEASAGEGKINSIPRAEIAAAIAEVLSTDKFGNSTLELTGPETFSYAEVADWLSEAYQKDIKYMNVNPEQVRKLYGGDSPFGFEIQGIISSYEAMQANEYDEVSDDFEKIMGRKPMSVKAFIQQQSRQSNVAG
ncbi:NAD(P)H dehydrogenase (quinone) [Catalinimonas alkaloidigena]|uniref:SDR family oxidoreductase n=1 Tax=Catalinimonas alkaloidigena TaxID=1075417 RepID=UPI0024054705|nr:SDR family oxidoreductase [Catalinimonas alkaloidigena]MDF9798431.1 NAD(P)H dehydrogenase (quinone) [Catalinimonas alkaloidigena]